MQGEDQLRARLTQDSHNTLDKIALHIIRFRIYNERQRRENPLSKPDADLNTLGAVQYKSHFEEWGDRKNTPLVINIYFQPKSGSSRILLEKWKLFLVKTDSSVDEKSKRKMEYPMYISSCRTLIRSVVSILPTLPTYRFLCMARANSWGKAVCTVDFSGGPFEEDTAFDNCRVAEYQFKNVELPFGFTYVKTCYREDCSFLIPQQREKTTVKVIDDYIPEEVKPTQNIDIPGVFVEPRNSSYESPSSFSRYVSTRSVSSVSPVVNSFTRPQSKRVDLSELFLGDSLVQSSFSNSQEFQSSIQSNSKLSLGSNSMGKLEGSTSSKHLSLSVSPFKESPIATVGFKISTPSVTMEATELPIEKSFLYQDTSEGSVSFDSDTYTQSSSVFEDSMHFSDDDIEDLISSCIAAASQSQEEADKLSSSSLSDYFGGSVDEIIADLESFGAQI